MEAPEFEGEKDWSIVIDQYNNKFSKAIDLCDSHLAVESVELPEGDVG